MQTNVEPLLTFTNAAALIQAYIPTGGVWLTTSLTNDTYCTPSITFIQGMDGTNCLCSSEASDLTGMSLAPTNCLSVVVDATSPVSWRLGFCRRSFSEHDLDHR